MAMQRKKVPIDPPEKLAVRERLKPVDMTQVQWKDPTNAGKWHLRWVNKNDRWFAQQQAAYGYTPVKRSEVQAGYAKGDNTGGEVHLGDLILCKCPMDEYKQRQADSALYHRELIRSGMENVAQVADSSGIKLEQTLTVGEGDEADTISVK